MMAMQQAVADPVADDFDPFADGGVERVLSTSDAQREVWLADRLGSDASCSFNESVSLRLRGVLDVPALRAALAALVQRHPLLRATLGPDGGDLLIGSATTVELPVADLRALAPDAAAGALREATARAVETPFMLEQGPLLRAELLRLADDDAVLLLTAHHIVCDGWSWGVIGEDLGALYTEFLGEGPGLEPADDYADYVSWERSQLSDTERTTLERYWLGRFQGSELPVLDLPTDHPRPPQRSFASRRIDHVVPANVLQALQRSAAATGVSLFAALLAGFAATLQRLSGQDDLVIGVPSAGQSTSGLSRLVGHCVNLLPLRLSVDPAQSAAALMQQTGGHVLDAFDNAALTYGTLLSCLPLRRDPSRLPLVSVMFNLDPAARTRLLGFAGLQVTLDGNPRHYENFELFLNAVRLGDGSLLLECQYSTALFDGATVARWLRCYETLLVAVAADPSCVVGRLPMLSPQDLDALHALQPPRETAPLSGLMHAAFAERRRTHADTPAVRCQGEAMSYADLDARSNRLAHALRARGIGRGARVGLCLPRGVEMLAALLGVLKAGAAYVPLDPAFPPARLDYYAEDAALALLITHSSVAHSPDRWCADAAQRLLRLDVDTDWQRQPAADLAPGPLDAGPDDPAYVIYTSGSTGRPKGVVVPHRAAANFLAAMQQAPGMADGECLAAVTTLSFDIAVLELLLPLAVGGTVEIVPRETVTDGPGLLALLAGSGATVMQATPGLWRMLVEAGWSGGPGFRALVGGESLPPDLAQDLLARCTEVWNLYGPTETTVWSTAWRAQPGQPVSIGRPIRHTSVWVLDALGQPCPLGVPGELCIGGDGVALGYLERPELTAERFVADPYSAVPGARLYRTGDRGRWRSDGLLEHLGRLDLQVKVRGYRIELGEIEAACSAVPGVSDCAVLAREDSPGDLRLVAYVVAQPDATVDAGSLREALRVSLPDYMLPQHVVALPALPRLPNGKLDRRALPAPAPAATAEGARIAPRTEHEARVLALMEDVLKLPGLGLHDDFFALGGHSLLGARLITRLNQAFGTALSLRALFDAPTAERLAAAVEGARAEGMPALPTLRHDPARRSAALTPMQERMRFIDEMYPESSGYNTPSVHRLTGPIDEAAFGRAFARMLQRQPVLRCVVAQDAAGGWCLAVREDLVVPMPVHDLRGLPAAEREQRLQADLRDLQTRPFDLKQGPLLRAALYRLEDELSVWGFVPHHIVWDGWSFDVMYDEMAGLYAAELGAAPEPAPPPFSALDYAEGYNAWLAGDGARRQVAWWRSRFERVPMPAPMPADQVRRGGMIGRGGSHVLRVGLDDLQALQATARAYGVTVNMLALSVLTALLGNLSSSPSVIVGVPVRGRDVGDLERTLGFFNNLLPVPLQYDPGQTLEQSAAAVKRELLDAMAHQQVPFEWLSALPEVSSRSTAAGLYQASFSYQDGRERTLQWGPLAHQRMLSFRRSTTEELSVWLLELPDGLVGAVNYRGDVYSEGAAAALRDRYLELLQRAGKGGTLTLAALLEAGGSPAAARLQELVAAASALEEAQRKAKASRSARPPAPALKGREADLAALWAELLSIDVAQVRAGDNFFDLGGDSMMAMRAVELTASRLGLRVEARRYIFETLGQIASTEPGAPAPAEAAPAPAPKARLSRLFSAFGLGR